MAVPGNGPNQNPVQGRKNRLTTLIDRWEELRRKIADAIDVLDNQRGATGPEASVDVEGLKRELDRLRAEREETVDAIQTLVTAHPALRNDAIAAGFRADLLPARPSGDGAAALPGDRGQEVEEREDAQVGGTRTGGGGGGGSSGGGGGSGQKEKPDLRAQAKDNRLLGDYGKDFDLVKGPKGSYVIRYRFKIAGEVVSVGLRVNAGNLGRYGLRPEQAKNLSREQMKRIKNIGYADQLSQHIRKGDSNIMKSLVRSLSTQYEGQAVLEDDQVMSVIIANSLFGWTPGEFENQLRNTRWFKDTNDYQRNWVTVVSPKQKAQTIREYQQRMIDTLEDEYGLEWIKHVEGGMKQVREWAQRIASGAMGTTPDRGFELWAGRMFDKAKQIEGTPAWMKEEAEQEEIRGRANRPEDMYEQLRAEADRWLGQRWRPDRATLMQWANDLVSENKSDGEWTQWLRQQTKALHPWKNDDTPWQDIASSYRAIIEDELRAPIDWNDKLLWSLGDQEGKAPLSAHEFTLAVRQDDRAWREGTRLWDEGTQIASQLANIFQGVSF